MATMTPVPESPVTLLHRISRIVSSELSFEEMLGEIVGLTSQMTGCDACLVYLVEMPTERKSSCAHRRCRTPRTWEICV